MPELKKRARPSDDKSSTSKEKGKGKATVSGLTKSTPYDIPENPIATAPGALWPCALPGPHAGEQDFILGIDEAGRGPVLGPMVYGAAMCRVGDHDSLRGLGVDDSKACPVLTEARRDELADKILARHRRASQHPCIANCRPSFAGSCSQSFAALPLSGASPLASLVLPPFHCTVVTPFCYPNRSDHTEYVLAQLSAQHISRRMLQRVPDGLNVISHEAAIWLIRKSMDFISSNNEQAPGPPSNLPSHRMDCHTVGQVLPGPPKKPVQGQLVGIYVDTVGPPDKYQDKLKRLFPNIHIIVTSKADSKYPVASAASIMAKTNRDKLISSWDFGEVGGPSIGWGSGYPADPNTKAWLKEATDPVSPWSYPVPRNADCHSEFEMCLGHGHPTFGFPDIVQFSWATAKEAMKQVAMQPGHPAIAPAAEPASPLMMLPASHCLQASCLAVKWPNEDQDEETALQKMLKYSLLFLAIAAPCPKGWAPTSL
eukprot:gene6045-1081_t